MRMARRVVMSWGCGEADGDGGFGSDVVGGGEVVGELVGLLVSCW